MRCVSPMDGIALGATATGADARDTGALVAVWADAIATVATAGGTATAGSAADFGSYFLVRFKRTSFTIAFRVSCTPMPVVATDS